MKGCWSKNCGTWIRVRVGVHICMCVCVRAWWWCLQPPINCSAPRVRAYVCYGFQGTLLQNDAGEVFRLPFAFPTLRVVPRLSRVACVPWSGIPSLVLVYRHQEPVIFC
uniref:Uncharacterized protein n=1 Tax=Trypanosoma vivax (strain Y486) TaxID=1055687 RepID=G0TWG0_TRYVY|nr:conserved hypothetical protein [Trypanosoma vivax Y486]